EIKPGDRILDFGCGAGATGIAAWRRTGGTGHVTFIDSNVRATAGTELNAKAGGVAHFDTVSAPPPNRLAPNSDDVFLTSPPYYAIETIAPFFVESSLRLLRPGGRFYLVTNQLDLIEPIVDNAYPDAEMFENRGYIIFAATKPG